MSHTMDPLFVHEAFPGLAASNDFGWLALEPLLDDWPGWLISDNDDAATSDASPTTLPSVLPSHPAPVLLPVTASAEKCADQLALTPTAAPATVYTSCHAASKGEKRLRPRALTMVLRTWMERFPRAPYASLEEKKMIAGVLSIPVEQVTNFCNNYRKRFHKVGTKMTSYRELAAAAP